MPAVFESLLKSKPSDEADQADEAGTVGEALETFVSDNQSRSVVSGIIISIALMIFALIVMGIFSWAYQKDKNLFIVVFATVVLLFTITVTILLAILRSKMGFDAFRFYMGSAIFMNFLTLLIIIFFGIKTSTRSLPSSVEDYLSKKI
jgi:heme A synthase